MEGYYRWQRSIFDYSTGAELSINPLVETQLLKGSGKAYGAELLINKKKGVMTGWLSYTYARSFEKILGDFPDLQKLNRGDWFRTSIDKPHTLNVVLNFQSERHNAVSFNFVYSTGRPYTAPISFYKNGFNIYPVCTDRHNGRISDYHRLDFSWTIANPSGEPRRWQGSWVVTIYNLYGRKNAFSYFFNPQLATFKPFKVSVFPTPPHKFYYLRVEQRSITASVFAYLKSLETQTQNVGSIFDIPPQTKFNPNVFNVNQPTEQILGVFSVYSARRKGLNINMQQNIDGVTAKTVIDFRPFTPNPLASAPCTETLYRTQTKPEGWMD